MADATTLTFGQLARRASDWVKKDLTRAAKVAGVAFAISWLVNFAVITTRGYVWGDLVAASTEGEEFPGAVYWAILSLALGAIVAYGVEAGWADLRRSFSALPRAILRLFKDNGVRMWSIVLWGAAVTLAISGALAPPLSAALGIGFLAFSPTAITGILGRLITRVWVALIGIFAPKAKPEAPGLGGHLVVVTGAALGFLVASRSNEVAFKLIAAAILAVLSHLALLNKPGKATQAAAFIGLAAAWWLGMSAVAEAFQGCCGGEAHHHPIEDTARAAGLSAIGGAAGAVGGLIGAGVGVALAASPVSPSQWTDFYGSGHGARVTSHPLPDGPSRDTTITLEGEKAREALEAWREAQRQGSEADISLPEDEQWDVLITDADGNPVARSGHSGTRGRITNIGAVVEGEDGSIVITVDVTAYNPSGTTPPAPIDPGDPGPTSDGSEDGPSDDGVVDGSMDDGAEPDTADPGDDAGDDSPPEEEITAPPPPPPDPADATPEATGITDDTSVVPPPMEEPEASDDDHRRRLTEEDLEADEDKPKPSSRPDGSDPGAYAGWVDRKAAGTLTEDDRAALGALIRGDENEVVLSGTFEGRWAPLLSRTEARPDGVAVKFPTGDNILVRVRNGRVEVKHEASLIGLFADAVSDTAANVGVEIPRISDVLQGVEEPLGAFNRAVESTGRQVESISRRPNGEIVINTRSKE